MFNKKGQAFTEGIFIFPVIIVLVFSVVWFAHLLLTWQQLISATRYGTDMIANTSLKKEDIKKDIENYLTHRMIVGRRLDISKIKEINVNIVNYAVTDINCLDVNFLFNVSKNLFFPSTELSSVSIIYSYDLPQIMHLVGMKEIDIKTKLFVLAGSGCKNTIHKRN